MDHAWSWERTEAGRPGMSGDIAKLFRHEEPKTPGVFAIDAPPAAATLLAREVIQNSWDAARELQVQDEHTPQFEIDFRFEELRGSAKQSLVQALNLGNLAARVMQIDRAKIGLTADDCLSSLNSDEPLQVLKIIESAASGMYGPWEQNKSHMFLALLSIGFTEKFTGAGGSYGYGKAGLINGSRIRSVVAYTCFREQPSDPGVTRRLLGVTYWGPHDYEGMNHPGMGTFSNGSAGGILPFENEEADQIARQLGIDLRSPARHEDLGTTFLLIDTPIKPRDLVRAIERSWWPAIIEGDFVTRVFDFDGSTLVPRPMKDPVLHTFIDAWEIAMGRSKPGQEGYFSKLSGPTSDPSLSTVGNLGLVADLQDWSYAGHLVRPGDDDVSHRSLIALTRSPKMVVEYFEMNRTPPYIRGVFIADDAIDNDLRLTEPKAHDSWRIKAGDDELAPEAAAIADHVIQRIKQTVNNFRTRLKPPAPPPEDVDLPFFNDIMRKMMSGMARGVKQPVPDTRPISIRLEYEPREAPSPGFVQLVGSVSYSLSEHFEGERASVVLTIAYRFIEDDRLGDHAEVAITPPVGFTSIGDGSFTGILERGTEARFSFGSFPYDPSWSGRLIVNGEITSASPKESASE